MKAAIPRVGAVLGHVDRHVHEGNASASLSPSFAGQREAHLVFRGFVDVVFRFDRRFTDLHFRCQDRIRRREGAPSSTALAAPSPSPQAPNAAPATIVSGMASNTSRQLLAQLRHPTRRSIFNPAPSARRSHQAQSGAQ